MDKPEVRYYYNREASFESLTAGITYEDPKFNLNLVQKIEVRSDRPAIRTTKWQRLSFYRAFTTTTSKTDIITTQKIDINSFLWFYAANVFFKCLPHSFVHYFLAAYAPDEHMFVPKMVPFGHGIKYLIAITGILELSAINDVLLLLFHYLIMGPMRGNPWNKCPEKSYFDEILNVTMHCYEMEEFAKKFNQTNVKYLEFTFVAEDGENFSVSHIDYYRRLAFNIVAAQDMVNFALIWGSLQIVQFMSKTQVFWKIFMISENILIFFDVLTFIYILSDIDTAGSGVPVAKIPIVKSKRTSIWNSDLELLAQSITAPPIIHLLTSRSNEEIDPVTDSSITIFSNAVYYVFKGLLHNKVRAHCEERVHTQLPITHFNHHTWLYFRTMFFTDLYLGDLFSMLYIVIYFIVEYCMIIATYLCVVEPIIYEWPKVKRWMVFIFITANGVVLYLTVSIDSRLVIWTYSKSIVTLGEILFLYCMYPVGRLVDDFTFHYGNSLTKMRILSLQIVPVYCIIKLYVMISSLWIVMETSPVGLDVTHYYWSWMVFLLPITLGMIYTIYKYLGINRMTWSHIFRPLPKWGPRDFSLRQLRKQFDSRYYIGSEVPRLLSRYLMAKRESKVYKVDVRYDYFRKASIGGDRIKVAFGEANKKKD